MLRLTGIGERERGAIAAIVAMLFGFGVLLSLAALTVDVGNINADRRQLQNGADAVALAVAQQCVTDGTCDIITEAKLDKLKALANANAADGATSIQRVDGAIGTALAGGPAICGNAPGLTDCPTTPAWTAGISKLQECPSTPSGNYVRVYTETENSDHQNILPYYFGAALTGISGANQQACATVTYGPPAGSPAPITLSYCEWQKATGYDAGPPVSASYLTDPAGAAPGYGGDAPQPAWPTPAKQLPSPTVAGQEIIIVLQSTSGASACQTWNGHDVPGGFGYLSTSAGCTTTATAGGWIQIDPGNSLPNTCSLTPYLNKVIFLPVFDCVATGTVTVPPSLIIYSGSPCNVGNGNNTWYHIQGYAKFYLSGYKIGGGPSDTAPRLNYPAASVESPRKPDPCAGSDRCISGWFLQGLVEASAIPAPIPPSGPSLGAYQISLSG